MTFLIKRRNRENTKTRSNTFGNRLNAFEGRLNKFAFFLFLLFIRRVTFSPCSLSYSAARVNVIRQNDHSLEQPCAFFYRALTKSKVPTGWQGGLGFDYHLEMADNEAR